MLACWRAGGSLVLPLLLVGCTSTPLTPTGGGGFGALGGRGAAGSTGGAGGAPGPIGSTGWAGFCGAGAAMGWAGASGTGGPPVDASVPVPWTYKGQRVTKVDVQRCPPYYGCDVCTLTL